ncbi:MAG: hypothetical protein GC138_06860 [Gammaproteobacteria bacterium]|nr:hypothetical protein [Gammaproteobacteria bacterium]
MSAAIECIKKAAQTFNDGKVSESVGLFRQAIDLQPNWAHSYFLLSQAMCSKEYHESRSGVFAEAEKYAEIATRIDPNNPQFYEQLAVTMTLQGRRADSYDPLARAVELQPDNEKLQIQAGLAAVEAENYAAAESHFSQAQVIKPDNNVASAHLTALQALKHKHTHTKKRLSRWPSTPEKLGRTIEEAVRKHVLSRHEYPKILREDSKIVTMGSCFAAHVANRLKEEGYDAQTIAIGEQINNSYSNRYLLDWILGKNPSRGVEQIKGVMSATNPVETLEKIRTADVLIYTLGVAPAFFHPTTGEIAIPGQVDITELMSNFVYRNTGVQENVANIRYIINSIREINRNIHFVASVSPVPLNATFGEASAFQADCLSKSTLRVAVNEVIQAEKEGVTYWPAFEAIRWLGAYLGPMYGQEDGSTGHVSEEVVGVMTSLFVEKFSVVKGA